MTYNNLSVNPESDPCVENSAGTRARDKAKAKKGRWSLFGGAGKVTEAEKRLSRLEELQHDLYGENSALCEYAINTLFSMLWMETEQAQLAVACALNGVSLHMEAGQASPFAVRLCYHVRAVSSDPLQTLAVTPLLPPKGAQLRAWVAQTLLAVFTDTLNTIKRMLRQTPTPETDVLYQETDVCIAVLRLAARLKSPVHVEAALRLLRLFPPDLAREPGPFGRQTPELRSLAALYLAALPPDDLYPLWIALNGSDSDVRQTLLPVLDYLSDANAVPYLIKMLERHSQWANGDMAAWATIRALQRLRDRRALPVLRRLIALSERAASIASPGRANSALNPALAQAARRAIESIEHQRLPKERFFLLRPSQPDPTHLLRPAEETIGDQDQTELLRPETE